MASPVLRSMTSRTSPYLIQGLEVDTVLALFLLLIGGYIRDIIRHPDRHFDFQHVVGLEAFGQMLNVEVHQDFENCVFFVELQFCVSCIYAVKVEGCYRTIAGGRLATVVKAIPVEKGAQVIILQNVHVLVS